MTATKTAGWDNPLNLWHRVKINGVWVWVRR